jgi:hypothetical protein
MSLSPSPSPSIWKILLLFQLYLRGLDDDDDDDGFTLLGVK